MREPDGLIALAAAVMAGLALYLFLRRANDRRHSATRGSAEKAITKPPIPPSPPERPLRRFTPRGTSATDFVIPCPACGWNTAKPRSWILANDTFICPRCGASTHLDKVTSGPVTDRTITDEFDRITKGKPKH